MSYGRWFGKAVWRSWLQYHVLFFLQGIERTYFSKGFLNLSHTPKYINAQNVGGFLFLPFSIWIHLFLNSKKIPIPISLSFSLEVCIICFFLEGLPYFLLISLALELAYLTFLMNLHFPDKWKHRGLFFKTETVGLPFCFTGISIHDALGNGEWSKISLAGFCCLSVSFCICLSIYCYHLRFISGCLMSHSACSLPILFT